MSMFTPDEYQNHIGDFIASGGNPIVFMQLLQGAVPHEIMTIYNCLGTSSNICRKANDDFKRKHPKK